MQRLVFYSSTILSELPAHAYPGPSPNLYLISLLTTLIKGVSFLIIGRISDIIGRRWFLIGGQFMCAVGSVVSAIATNISQYLCTRISQTV